MTRAKVWSLVKVRRKRENMGLRIERIAAKRNKLLLSVAAVLALVMQPVYGVVERKVAEALTITSHIVINEVAPSKASTDTKWVELYNPTAVAINVKGWKFVRNTSTDVSPIISNDDVSIQPKSFYVYETTKSFTTDASLLKLVNAAGETVDSVDYPTLTAGQVYARSYDAGSNFETRSGAGITKGASNGSEPQTPVVTAELNAENFNTHKDADYEGISVGFNGKNFGTVSDITVVLTREDGSTVTKRANHAAKELLSGKTTATQLSTPFIIKEGTFTEAADTDYWQPAVYSSANAWVATTQPKSVTISVTDEKGTKTTSNTIFSQGAPSWPTYASLTKETPAPEPAPTAVTNIRTTATYKGLQAAVDAAEAGDTLRLNENLSLTDDVDVTKSLTIDGNRKTLTSNFVKTGNDNNSALSILASNVTIKNLTVDGVDADKNQLHGINAYQVTNLTVENVTARNYRSGVLYNGATGTLKNSAFANNKWHDINVDKSGANVTVSGVNTHDGSQPNIYVDDDKAGVTVMAHAYEWKKSGRADKPNDRVYSPDVTSPRITVKDDFKGDKEAKIFSQISFSLNDAVMADKYSLNGRANDFANNQWSDANYANIRSQLTQGNNYLELYDVAGNKATYMFVYDTVAPEVTNIQQKYETKENGRIAVELTFSEKVIGDTIGQGWSEVKGSNGTKFVKRYYKTQEQTVTFADQARNIGSYTFVVDKTAPEAPVFSVQGFTNGGVTNKQNITATWEKTSDDTVSYEYNYWNNIENNRYKEQTPYVVTTAGLSHSGSFNQGDGTHYMRVRAIDAVGNVSAWSNVFTVIYDSKAPVIATNVEQGDVLSGQTALYLKTEGEANPNITNIRVLGADGNPAGSQHLYKANSSNSEVLLLDTTTLANGQYKIQFSARDKGNNAAKVVTRNVTINNVAPVVKTAVLGPVQYDEINKRLYGTFTVSGGTANEVQLRVTINDGDAPIVVEADDIAETETVGVYAWSLDVSEFVGNDNTAVVRAILNGKEQDVSQSRTFSVNGIPTDPTDPMEGDNGQGTGAAESPSNSGPSTVAPVQTVPVFAQTVSLPTTLGTSSANAFGFATLFSDDSLASDDDAEVLGTSDARRSVLGSADKAAALATDGDAKASSGIAWYWWLVGALVAVGLLWLLIAALRRDSTRDAYFQK